MLRSMENDMIKLGWTAGVSRIIPDFELERTEHWHTTPLRTLNIRIT